MRATAAGGPDARVTQRARTGLRQKRAQENLMTASAIPDALTP